MTGLPGWATAYALDDDALVVLANRGQVRRASKEVGRFEASAIGDDRIELRYTGTPPATVRLVPGGPRRAVCGCPAAGVCVHIVAACLWVRAGGLSLSEPPDVGDGGRSSVSRPAEGGEGSRQARPTEVSLEARPPVAPDVLAELLALEPAAVNRAAGIAAVRKVAARLPATPTSIDSTAGAIRISWPGSPEVVAVTGGGFSGMLVSGRHSDTAERAWRLEALVRLFAANGQAWTWPGNVESAEVVQPGQLDAMEQAAAVIEALLRAGLSRIGPDGVARLGAAAQRARLEALPLLATLLKQAEGRAAGVAAREDESSERALLDAVARAWTLATVLRSTPPPLPPHLIGGRRGAGERAEVGTLIPLGVRWWLAPSGSRGLTVTMWDSDHRRVETVTTGRAAGSDPSFERSWNAPLLWGASAQTFCQGVFTLADAERRDDGTLSPTSRTRIRTGMRFAEAGIDLTALERALSSAGTGAAAIGFLPRTVDVRLVVPRRLLGIGQPELDEVNQQLVWPITDRAGVHHLARMDALGPDQDVIGWLLRDGKQIAAVVLDAAGRPLSVIVVDHGRQRLISPSLTPPERPVHRGWVTRSPREQQPRAHEDVPPQQGEPVQQTCDAVLDVCEALASTGRPALSVWQRDTLGRRAAQASDLGLLSLAAAIEGLLSDPVNPTAVLRATLVASRVRALAEVA